MSVVKRLMLVEPCDTPTVEICEPLFDAAGIRVMMKRLDLVHPLISGNKWYKLKYNLLAARKQGHGTLLSFGGAYSNHIHALAAAGKLYEFNTIGVIRGEPHESLNSTLQFAVQQGMQLHYVSRQAYRQKQSDEFIAQLHDQFGEFYCVPEGGSNQLAVQGAAEIVHGIGDDVDYVACACGTGGTLAGIVMGLMGQGKALGIAVLKGGDFLNTDVQQFLSLAGKGMLTNWSINLDFHLGGYAKVGPELLGFMHRFEMQHQILLDPVYTAKLMYAIYALAERGYFLRGTTLLVIHSGGLQGRAGFDL